MDNIWRILIFEILYCCSKQIHVRQLIGRSTLYEPQGRPGGRNIGYDAPSLACMTGLHIMFYHILIDL